MVRNDKGLWVKVEDENPAGSAAPAPEAVAKVLAPSTDWNVGHVLSSLSGQHAPPRPNNLTS